MTTETQTDRDTRIWSDLAIPAGETLADELEARELDQATFAKTLGITRRHLTDLFSGRRPITAEIALKLESELGVEATFWMNLQSAYDLTLARIARAEATALPH